MRVATYHRVSTSDQRPEAARHELRAFCDRHGWQIAEEVEETGSGARADRPGLLHVLELARARRIDALVVWKLCRIGRSTLDVLDVIGRLDGYGVRFAAVSDPVDTLSGGPAGRLVLAILAAVAEMERDRIRENTRRGLAAARRRGSAIGRPRKVPLELAERVHDLRHGGASWSKVAAELGCTVAAARRLAQKGTQIGSLELDEKRAPGGALP